MVKNLRAEGIEAVRRYGAAAGPNAPLPTRHPAPLKKGIENRREPRYRTRLRSGSISSGHKGLICDCVIRDYSTNGARLLLPKNVIPPRIIWFYDDETQKAVRAEVIWQKGQEIGIMKLS